MPSTIYAHRVFTGIVREVGVVVSVAEAAGGRSLVVHAPVTAAGCAVGDSVALGGCCLTATAVAGDELAFHAVPETIARTTLGSARGRVTASTSSRRCGQGTRSAGTTSRVTSTVSGTSARSRPRGTGVRVAVGAPDDVLRYCVEKGSITVDGVSLTVAALADRAFAVVLVPHTLEATTLSDLELGQAVNLEVDVLAKYVERLLGQ